MPATAGRDCFPPHDPPPAGICNGVLCQTWLTTVSSYGVCKTNKHAHPAHYEVVTGKKVNFCPGRQYCDV